MILFKRVGESFRHIESREWALLFLETVGVLVGILLAFALQEWAQQRSDAVRHGQLMQRLFEESEMDIADMRYLRDVLREKVAAEKTFAIALAKGECPPEGQWQAVETIEMLPAVTAPNSVYQELLGAGGLSSVERWDVRAAIARFHSDLEWSQQQVAYFRQVKESPVPSRDPRVTIAYDPTRHDPEVFSFDRQALCADRGFRNSFAASLRQHIVFTDFYHQKPLEDAIAMCIRLGDSLGQSCTPASDGPLKGTDAEFAAKEIQKMRAERAKPS